MFIKVEFTGGAGTMSRPGRNVTIFHYTSIKGKKKRSKPSLILKVKSGKEGLEVLKYLRSI